MDHLGSISTLISSLDSLMETPQENFPDLEEHWEITNSAFNFLILKIQTYGQQLKILQQFFITNQVLFERNLNQFKFILPCWDRQIKSLSSLASIGIQNNPTEQIKLILEILLEIEQTKDQIERLLDFKQLSYNPEETQDSPASTDPSIKNITTFKHQRLILLLTTILEYLPQHLNACRYVIFDPNSANENPLIGVTNSEKIYVNNYRTFGRIDHLHQWLILSDYGVVQAEWRVLVKEADCLINSWFISTRARPNYDQSPTPLQQQLTKLGDLMLPILKLSRLFVTKLSKMAENKDPLMMYSERNSSEIITLLDLIPMITRDMNQLSRDLDRLICSFDPNIQNRPPESHELGDVLIPKIQVASKGFKSALFLLNAYLDPLSSAQFQNKIYLKNWLETWNHQFTLVTQLFVDGCAEA